MEWGRSTTRFAGYDGLPIDSLQGLDINCSYNESQSFYYDPLMNESRANLNSSGNGSANNEIASPYVHSRQQNQNPVNQTRSNANHLNHHNETCSSALPSPPMSNETNSQMAAWYDTDL